ncbi:type IX secretion system membrane protein PorP/SprF [Flavobacterium sp. CBA20B-1]|uniref:PorP/SprF family type IX secretion system membrane protein n=1 Tax=unclassified Flavobacterium TaxID=196869 RepID=UPI0022259F41|nr:MULTISPECIES: type IX secretion system membrane protein PorP/SprF [unclassified Flavobacterium]WCM41129.1 type IX secretion system membrane protein PorP/SprF [Flavobacterium sp. CBA20B-1]
MKINKSIVAVVCILLGSLKGFAQQDPHYTQYMYNQSILNPAYAGINEYMSTGVLYRSQWLGMNDAPKTATAFVHTPVAKNLGVGLSFINDNIGPVSENNVYADVSYTIRLGKGHSLALGVKGGVTMQNIGLFSDINSTLPDKSDIVFAEDSSATNFNVGAGLFYFTNKYYVGFSMPNFLQNTFVEKNNRKFGTDVAHMFLTGGYVFDLNREWKLKPSTMLKMAVESPVSADLSLNTLYDEKLEFGVSYRLQDSFGAMVNYRVTPKLRVGYAYDYVTSALNYSTSGSHEVFILFDIFYKKKVSSSPRFF